MSGRVSVGDVVETKNKPPEQSGVNGPTFRLRVKFTEEELKRRIVAALTAMLAEGTSR